MLHIICMVISKSKHIESSPPQPTQCMKGCRKKDKKSSKVIYLSDRNKMWNMLKSKIWWFKSLRHKGFLRKKKKLLEAFFYAIRKPPSKQIASLLLKDSEDSFQEARKPTSKWLGNFQSRGSEFFFRPAPFKWFGSSLSGYSVAHFWKWLEKFLSRGWECFFPEA